MGHHWVLRRIWMRTVSRRFGLRLRWLIVFSSASLLMLLLSVEYALGTSAPRSHQLRAGHNTLLFMSSASGRMAVGWVTTRTIRKIAYDMSDPETALWLKMECSVPFPTMGARTCTSYLWDTIVVRTIASGEVSDQAVSCPWWAILPVLGALSSFSGFRCLRAFARRAMRDLEHCQRCGYNLTGNVSGRCPECGAATGHRTGAGD